MNTTSTLIAAIAVASLVGAAVGYGVAARDKGNGNPERPMNATAMPSNADARQPLYWYDPMNPQQHFERAGKSPFMDMQLVPKYAAAPADGEGRAVDARTAHNLAIRYATVEKTRFTTTLEAPATVLFNERDVAVVQARSAGFVERVYARAPGDVIAAGAPLAELLVPEWSALQIEFQAVAARGDVGLVAAMRQRMHLAGMPESLVADMEHTGQARPAVIVRAPIAGVIQELGIRAGMSVPAGSTLARINGLSPIWIEGAVPARQAGTIKVGQNAEALIDGIAQPGRRGKVTAILPEMNRESRTLRVRVELANPGGVLRPGMFATLRFETTASDALTVPAEAVIRVEGGARVIVADAQGRLKPLPVTLGTESSGRVVIASGLREGDRIVASGQFLIDSEANLSGALARLQESMPATLGTDGARVVQEQKKAQP
jgi:membrane fusion protein, copper/silver efflux system